MPLKFGILREMGIPDHFTCPMRNLYVVQEEPYMEQQIGSKLGNEYIKAGVPILNLVNQNFQQGDEDADIFLSSLDDSTGHTGGMTTG